jgi:hypothetical protein
MSGSDIYHGFLKDAREAQETRKTSFEQRGLAVVATAGTLVTLLFGLTTLVTTTGSHPHELGHEERVWLAIALALFVASAVGALVTNFPIRYAGVQASAVRGRLDDERFASDESARRDVAKTEVKLLADAQVKNAIKGWFLFAALLLEVGAVFCVGAAILEVIHP